MRMVSRSLKKEVVGLRWERWVSPIDDLLIVTDESGALRALEFADLEARVHRLMRQQYGGYTFEEGEAPGSIKAALAAYFDGKMDGLADVQVATGGTDFQREVWKALRSIPAGTTMTYGQLARDLGRAEASRAVGAANGANPINIVVPCHRVIGANGALTGYGGGLPRKRWLIAHEERSISSGVPAAGGGDLNEGTLWSRLEWGCQK